MPEKAKRKRMAKGSFTVEAALLMTVLLPVIVSLIYTAFFLHDRTLLQGAACEVAAMGSNLSEEKDIDQILEKIKNQVMSARLLGTKDKAATVNRSKGIFEPCEMVTQKERFSVYNPDNLVTCNFCHFQMFLIASTRIFCITSTLFLKFSRIISSDTGFSSSFQQS